MTRILFVSSLFILLALPLPARAEKQQFWDLSIGTGINLDGNGTEQIMVTPAFNRRMPGQELLWYRVEANVEVIKDGKFTAVLGVAPFLRLYLAQAGPKPFVEIGAGANIITRNHTGSKESGGAFLFSPSLGAGVQFGRSPIIRSISMRFRHLSNAHIYKINESINTLYVLFSIGL